MANGDLRLLDKAMLAEIGKWIKFNKDFIYDVKRADIKAENAILLKNDDGKYFAVTSVPTISNTEHASLGGSVSDVKIDAEIKCARWLDSGKRIKVLKKNSYKTVPFEYGVSMAYRVAKLEIE